MTWSIPQNYIAEPTCVGKMGFGWAMVSLVASDKSRVGVPGATGWLCARPINFEVVAAASSCTICYQ